MPSTPITSSQLRRRKIEAVQLCLSFSYAVKHYLRGEDGIAYEDYRGVLPASFNRFDENVSGPRTDMTGSIYSTITSPSGNATPGGSGRSSPDPINVSKADATKRVRHKRSKKDLPGQHTPLLGHRTIDFEPLTDDSMPLPLV